MIVKKFLLVFGVFSALYLAKAANTVSAGCFEIIGCTNNSFFKERDLRLLGCQPLADVRNSIYAENRYCFKSSKYINLYGNEGCRYRNPLAVPLNSYERANVRLIRKVERDKGCVD